MMTSDQKLMTEEEQEPGYGANHTHTLTGPHFQRQPLCLQLQFCLIKLCDVQNHRVAGQAAITLTPLPTAPRQ